jgi:predicted dehydrogenase|tara:strand:+ start:3488 stop:4618 length:1131 start_codon:yes stop_codon:yes gene_type:complete
LKPIGIGVIGTGFMGKAHSIAYSASASVFGIGLRPNLEIVCDLSPERANQRATDLGFSRHTDKWQDVVNDPRVDLISVCTPNNTHSEISIAALEKGKHVWCEKPMSSSLEDSQIMAEVAEKSNSKTIVGYNYTKNPVVIHARKIIEKGTIGRISGFFCRYDVDNEADGSKPWSWRMSKELSGTGSNGDILSHVISVGHYLINSRISNVVGDISIIHKQRKDPKENEKSKIVDNDDMVSALVHFENGVHGHIGASRVSWGKKCGLTWEIHGTEGTITYNQERLNEIKLFTRQSDSSTDGFRTILSGPEHPFYSSFLPNGGHGLGFMDVKICELQGLLNAIENNKPTWPNFNDGLAIEKVMERIDESAITKQWLSIQH